jgi:hypothetical protein
MIKDSKYNSFKFYAEKLIEKQRREVRTGAESVRFLSDDLKIIKREDDGLLTNFRDYPIDEITTSAMRQYFDLPGIVAADTSIGSLPAKGNIVYAITPATAIEMITNTARIRGSHSY